MVNQLSETQKERLKKAYFSGVSTEDLVERFGVCNKSIVLIARGQLNPMVYDPGDALSYPLESEIEKKRRVKACKLHYQDLVKAYRPDIIERFKEIIKERRRRMLAARMPVKPIQEPKEKREPLISAKVSRRSARIFAEALKYFEMTAEELTGSTRTKNYVKARQILMFVIYTECSRYESTPSIGRMFNKDHSTVVHAVHKIRDMLKNEDAETIKIVNHLRSVQ